jgi:acyl-coenzyme A thioesterase PaaI-like protein
VSGTEQQAPMAADPTYYVAQVAFSTHVDGDVVRSNGVVVPEACVPGTESLRTSVISLWADVIAGAAGGLAISPRIPLTLDLEVLVRRPFTAGSAVVGEGRVVRAGRSVVVTEATFGDGVDPEPLAIAVATFVPSPDVTHVFDGGFPVPVFPDDARLTVPLAERLGCRVLAPGTVEMPRRPDALNAVGAVQGGAVATALEEAATSLSPEPSHLESFTVRYLRPVMEGPALAVATPAGPLRTVRLVDTSNGKLCALATARMAPEA